MRLCENLIGPKGNFESNFQFFASLDFIERLVVNADMLRNTMGSYYSAIEDILDTFNAAFKSFIKNFAKYMVDENKRPDNEQISHITYKAMSLVSQLQDFHKVLSNLEIEAEMSGAILKSVIKLLVENKSYFKLKNPLIPSIYILNNLFYMISKTKSEDTEAVIDYSIKDMMDELFERHIGEYLKIAWGHLSDTLEHDIEAAYEKNGNLKTSTREAIKKRFADFNKIVVEFQKMHTNLWYTSKEFTETLQRKNKKHVLPKYQSFYNTYGELSFTKNRDKYVKNTLPQLSDLIDGTIKFSYTAAANVK